MNPSSDEKTWQIPVVVDAKDHTCKIRILDIYLDRDGNKKGEDIRDSLSIYMGEKVEVSALDLVDYHPVSDVNIMFTAEEDTDVRFYYQMDGAVNDEEKPADDDKKPEGNHDDDKKKKDDSKKDEGNTSDNSDPNGNDDNTDDQITPSKDKTISPDKAVIKKDKKKIGKKNTGNSYNDDVYDTQGDNQSGEAPSLKEGENSQEESVMTVTKAGSNTEGEPVIYTGKTKHDEDIKRTVRAMKFGIITSLLAVALTATGAFRYLWMLILMLFTKNKKKKWHGILTSKRSRFIELSGVTEGSKKTVQDYIDENPDLLELQETLKGLKEITYLPFNTKMDILYDGIVETGLSADEDRLYAILSVIEAGRGPVYVTIHNSLAGFSINLTYDI